MLGCSILPAEIEVITKLFTVIQIDAYGNGCFHFFRFGGVRINNVVQLVQPFGIITYGIDFINDFLIYIIEVRLVFHKLLIRQDGS